jgi:uncharacterized protein (TIGR00725 family)
MTNRRVAKFEGGITEMSLESMTPKPIIAVVGTKDFSAKFDPALPEHLEEFAFRVGEEIARSECWLICGGLTGVMEAVAQGAKNNDGFTIGIIPGAVRDLNDDSKKKWPNAFIDVAIFTGLDRERDKVIVNSCDAMIALPGSNQPDKGKGTRYEINFAIENGTPVALHEYWSRVDDPISVSSSTVRYFTEEDAEDAVNTASAAIPHRSHKKTTSRRPRR